MRGRGELEVTPKHRKGRPLHSCLHIRRRERRGRKGLLYGRAGTCPPWVGAARGWGETEPPRHQGRQDSIGDGPQRPLLFVGGCSAERQRAQGPKNQEV